MTALALLCLGWSASMVWWRWAGPQEGTPAPQDSPLQRAPPGQALPPAPSPVTAGPSSGPLLAGTPAEELSPRAQRMRADWCGYGAVESAKEERARSALDSEALERLDGIRVLRAAQRQLRARWVRQLSERGDQRSLAIAAFLDEAFQHLPPEDPGSRVRLQDLARRSTDPLVTALALQRPCGPGQCVTIEATQWSRLEPDNALAWMAQWRGAALPPHRQLELITQMAAQARHADTHNRALLQVLRSLPAASEPGLPHLAESMLLFDFRADQASSLLALPGACGKGSEQPELRQACLAIAERFWQQDDAFLRSTAVDMAAPRPPRSEPWAARAMLVEAVRRAVADLDQQELQVLETRMPRDPCGSLPALRAWLERRLELDDWRRGLDIVQGSGLDTRAWLLRWHDAHPDIERPAWLAPAAPASR